MHIEVLPDPEAVALRGARHIAELARTAAEERGRFVLAVSGGTTPWRMLSLLVEEDIPWERVYLVQVDERVAPVGHADRNLTHLVQCLAACPRLPPQQVHALPVGMPDLSLAAAEYARTLEQFAGKPPVIDLAHLGLGTDGHTASLTPGDPVLEVTDADVAPTGVYLGRRRLTLTYPILNRARARLWLATGAAKADMLARLLAGDATIPAGRVAAAQALVLADREAAGMVDAAAC